MSRRQGGETAAYLFNIADIAVGVSAARRAARNAAGRVELDVAGDDRRICSRACGLAGFQRPFIDGGINLAQVVDAGVSEVSSAMFSNHPQTRRKRKAQCFAS